MSGTRAVYPPSSGSGISSTVGRFMSLIPACMAAMRGGGLTTRRRLPACPTVDEQVDGVEQVGADQFGQGGREG